MLHHMSSTEYLNYESGKFSKSKGIGCLGTMSWKPVFLLMFGGFIFLEPTGNVRLYLCMVGLS